MSSDQSTYLSADVPITADSAERLGRMGFVRLLARRVLSYEGDRALVVGVCGPWGSGKTSLANLLLSEIRASRAAATRPVLEPVKFTPWALGTRDDLAQDLLREIGRMVKDRSGAETAAFEIGAQIAEVGTSLAVAGGSYAAGLPEWLSGAVAAAGLGGRVKDALGRWGRSRTAPSLQEATERVATKIRDSNALLVVALDDLERLPIDHILAVFRVVSAIADFPNTVYILCMDRHRVAEALKAEYGDGHAYLEKFLNLTFDVPPPDPDLLGALFVEQLNQVLSGRNVEVDDRRFGHVWHAGLKRVLQTPRDIVRVLNSYDIALDAIAEETDPVDLLALEALRVLEPGLHQELAKHPFGVLRQTKDLLALLGSRTDEEKAKRADEEMNTILAAASDDGKEAARALLGVLFPAARRGHQADGNALHRTKRAASADHFDNYFRWSLASGSLSEVELFREIDALVEARRDSELEEWFAKNDPRFAHLGEKLSHYTEATSDPARQYDIAAGLLRVADRLEDQGAMFIRSKHMTAISLAYHLIKHSPESWDAELWRRCEETSWLYGLTHLFAMQCGTNPRNRFDEFETPSDEIRSALSSSISRHLEAGEYNDHPSLAHFLYRWSDVAGDVTAPREWVHRKVAQSDRLVWSIIDPLINVSGTTELFGDHHRQLNRQNLEGLFDLDELRSYVRIVPHPRDATSIVDATARALDLDDG